VQTFVRCLDSRTPVRYHAKQMYAAGLSIRPFRSGMPVAVMRHMGEVLDGMTTSTAVQAVWVRASARKLAPHFLKRVARS